MNAYELFDLNALLKENAYPGRGIVVGRTADGTHAAVAYFIMGRSVNSRNRIFVKTEDGIRTEAHDPSKMVDPSLIIYHPVRLYDGRLIVTNGDQTDTVWNGLKQGECFAASLRTREFEPDGPNWTPRISAMVETDGSYQMSILKSADEAGTACARYTYEYPGINGVGHFIHTYACDGNPLPTFCGEPERVAIGNDFDAFTQNIWNNLNEENKISLYTCFRNIKTGQMQTCILNKHV